MYNTNKTVRKKGLPRAEGENMKVIVFVGGNKIYTASRLGVKLAQTLCSFGWDAGLCALKGKIKFAPGLEVKEYAGVTKPKTLAAWLKQEGADAVVSLMNLTGCRAAAEAGLPFVYAQTEDFKEDKPAKDKKTLLKKAKKVFVLKTSDGPLNKKAYAGLNVREAYFPVMGVGHDASFKPACFKKENNVVAIGKLTKEHAFDALLEAWTRLAPLHPTWHLTVMGDGAAQASLKKTRVKNGLEASCELVSDDGNPDALLRAADIFVCPSGVSSEGLADAMASTLPCVAAGSADAKRLLVSGVNGVVAPAGAEGLARALDGVMVDWGWRVGMALEAAKLNDKYPLAAFASMVAGALKD